MVKGGPSVNPLGRAYKAVKAAQRVAAPGTSGVVAYGGYVTNPGEKNQKLVGLQKWITFANMYNVAIVATAARYSNNLIAGTDWHLDPNPAGGRGAKKGLDVVQKGLLDAPLTTPWRQLAASQSMFRFGGFELAATAMRRRPDGLIVYSTIERRPPHTIEKWNRPNEQAPFESVDQRSPETGKVYNIPLDQCWYTVDDTLTSDPAGVGLLRHLADLLDRLGMYEGLEKRAYQSDLGGLPIARVPFEELAEQFKDLDEAQKKLSIDAAWATLREVMEKRQKSPELYPWLAIDSATYRGINDPNIISTIQKWALDIVKTETNGLADIDRVITRCEIEAARVLGIEYVMIGGDGSGTYNAHTDKTSMLGAQLEAAGDRLGWTATHQLARRLVIANGLDPDTCTPSVVMDPISTESIEVVTRALANMALAGFLPGSPIRNVLLRRMRLPPEEPTAIELNTGRPTRRPDPAGDGGDGGDDPSTPSGKPEAPTGTQPAATDKPTAKRGRRAA